jgi:[ribosomal protein S18]-alanine N-acetyltransferase
MGTPSRARRFEILPARLQDIDEVMEIERLSFKAPWTRQVFLEELQRDWAHLDVVRERGGAVVAFLNHWLVRDEVHILNLAAHPDYRRQGHGERLMRHVVEFARAHRCRVITLEVRRSNHAAIHLYRRFGFRAVGVRPNYYAEDGEDAIVMLLDLEPDE